jgi:hypothetical protein
LLYIYFICPLQVHFNEYLKTIYQPLDSHRSFIQNGYYSLFMPLSNTRMQTELYSLENEVRAVDSMINQFDLQTKHESKRYARPFDAVRVLSLPSIYQSILTHEFIDALISFFKGKQPYLFYAAFLYTTVKMGGQAIHRDTPRASLPSITVLIDLSGAVATTEFINESQFDFQCDGFDVDEIGDNQEQIVLHPRTGQARPLVRATTENNVLMLNSSTLHHALPASVDHIKLDLAFVSNPETEIEREAFRQHCVDYAIKYCIPDEREFPLLPIQYFK